MAAELTLIAHPMRGVGDRLDKHAEIFARVIGHIAIDTKAGHHDRIHGNRDPNEAHREPPYVRSEPNDVGLTHGIIAYAANPPSWPTSVLPGFFAPARTFPVLSSWSVFASASRSMR